IGTVPMRYGYGWLRHLQGFRVHVNRKRSEIDGRVCMDQCMIRLAEEFPAGSVVTLVGKDGNEENTFQLVAEKLETFH
ncbi:alanine racemase C-terminal domain-containing protein, partial [Enterococcus faecalis]|uniref:alanine racemase C-terminal domain-containing protein n=1 Tax=Enterococcus faecalis TaxID=1351 RepID=UPI003D6AD084